jgi:hypothetical protein
MAIYEALKPSQMLGLLDISSCSKVWRFRLLVVSAVVWFLYWTSSTQLATWCLACSESEGVAANADKGTI